MGLSEHSSDSLSNGPVCSLCNPILMRLIAHCVLTSYSSTSKELRELIGHILPTLVISQCQYLRIHQVLHKSLEPLECYKGLTLVLQLKDHAEAAVIINEGDPVLVTRSVLDRHFMEVRVNELEGELHGVWRL